MVFGGHTHVYEHFVVPDDSQATRARPSPVSFAHDGKAVHYLVTGGGGGPQPNSCATLWDERQEHSYDFSQARGCAYHFTWVHLHGDVLEVEVIAVDGDAQAYSLSTLDSFSIE